MAYASPSLKAVEIRTANRILSNSQPSDDGQFEKYNYDVIVEK